MDRGIRAFVAACQSCALSKDPRMWSLPAFPGPITSLMTSQWTLSRLPVSQGNSVILVCVDSFSKAHKISSKKTDELFWKAFSQLLGATASLGFRVQGFSPNPLARQRE